MFKILKFHLFFFSFILIFISCDKEDPEIIWENPADMIVGESLSTLQLNASCDIDGRFEYIPALGTKMALGANQELRVNFTPSDLKKYNTKSKVVTINVIDKLIPEITWNLPSELTVNTLLGFDEFNATANVSGTFSYSPDWGTYFWTPEDNIEFRVDFFPTDTIRYCSTSKIVMVTILPSLSPILFKYGLPYGTMTDQDGNVYKTITIGTQTWMAENLRTTTYRNGDAIPNITGVDEWTSLTTGAFSTYFNSTNVTLKSYYGLLYNWYAVSDSRNLAPEGWHVPSEEEWDILFNYVGSSDYLRESGESHWTISNYGADNRTGFTALPGGYRHDQNGDFAFATQYGFWWSSTTDGANKAWRYYLLRGDQYPSKGSRDFNYGFSVRCVKDN